MILCENKGLGEKEKLSEKKFLKIMKKKQILNERSISKKIKL